MLPDKPTIAVIGAGAVGSYYGARLAQAGFDVHLLTASDAAHIQKCGLRIRSCEGDFELSPSQIKAYSDPSLMPRADLVLVTLKTTANHRLGDLVKPVLKPQTLLLTLQNGLGNEDTLAELFGADRVLGGMAFVCLNRLEPGLVSHTDHGLIRIGEIKGPANPRLLQIAEIFTKGRITCQVIDDLPRGRWEKLIWNIPFNGLGAALDLTTDQLIASAEGVELVSKLMSEVIAACNPLGIHFDPGIVQEKIQHTRTMGAYKTSTQIDRHLGRPFELDAIFGKPLGIARSFHVATPFMNAVYEMLGTLNKVPLQLRRT